MILCLQKYEEHQFIFRLLPAEPCLSEGCTCTSDADCPGANDSGRCVACNCMQCPVSVGKDIINRPLTFVIDTTRLAFPAHHGLSKNDVTL